MTWVTMQSLAEGDDSPSKLSSHTGTSAAVGTKKDATTPTKAPAQADSRLSSPQGGTKAPSSPGGGFSFFGSGTRASAVAPTAMMTPSAARPASAGGGGDGEVVVVTHPVEPQPPRDEDASGGDAWVKKLRPLPPPPPDNSHAMKPRALRPPAPPPATPPQLVRISEAGGSIESLTTQDGQGCCGGCCGDCCCQFKCCRLGSRWIPAVLAITDCVMGLASGMTIKWVRVDYAGRCTEVQP